jgi:hypothetical protein
MRIELRIDRMVLEGVAVAPGDIPLLQEALVDELAALVRARGLAPGATRLDRVDAGEVDARPGDPDRLGRELAGTLHTALDALGGPAPGGDAQ